MKNKIKNILMLVLLGCPIMAHSETKDYFIENQKFSIDVPKNWKPVEGIFGSPLTLFGPEQKDAPRAAIIFSPTNVVDKNDVLKKMPSDLTSYKAGREDWLKEQLGEAGKYDDYQTTKWNGIEAAYLLGYHYELPAGKFYERSVYVTCAGNKVFYIKSLVPEALESDNNKLVDQTIKSLKCEKTTKTAAK